MADEFITVGKIVSVHGTKGLTKVASHTDFPERFTKGQIFYVYPPHGKYQTLKVEHASFRGDFGLVKFEEINNRGEANEIVEYWLEIPSKEAKKLPKGHFWIYQIIGLDVFTEEGELLGIIKEIIKTPANDVYVISSEQTEILIPAIKEVIKKIDLKRKRMVVSRIPGLF